MNYLPHTADDEDLLLEMDAVRLDAIATVDPKLMFAHVLSMPYACPRDGRLEFVLTSNSPNTLAIEVGQIGRKHLDCLRIFLEAHCGDTSAPIHIRTNGETVWVVKDATHA
jgi:hypothetical protein